MNAKPTVSQYMTRAVRTISVDARLSDAHALLREHAFSAMPAVDAAGVVRGVLSRTDLLREGRVSGSMRRDAPLLHFADDARVAAKMTAPAVTVAEDAPLEDAAALMLRHHFHRVVVVDARGALAGVCSTKDLMAAVRDLRHPALLGEFMSAPVLTVDALDTVSHATDKLQDANVAGLVVLEDGRPAGMFTQTEALQARELPATTAVEAVMSYAMLCLDRGSRMHRAAAHALATRARRVIVTEHHHVAGALTGMDFARALRALTA
jgi:CBS domain-containing protein